MSARLILVGAGTLSGGTVIAGDAGSNIMNMAGEARGGGGPDFTKEMLSQSRVIARGPEIRKIDVLIRKFGGTRKGWVKKSSCDQLGREWHWYEHSGIGRVGVKRPGGVDPI